MNCGHVPINWKKCAGKLKEMGQTVEGRFKRAERKARAVGRQAGRTVRDRKNPSGAAIARIRGNVTGPRGPEARKAKTCWLGAKPVDLPVICDLLPGIDQGPSHNLGVVQTTELT